MSNDDREHFTVSDEEWDRLQHEKVENEREQAVAKAHKKYGGGANGKDNDGKKQPHYVQKYSEIGLLAEAVIVGFIPYFAVSKADSKSVMLKESIPISDTSEYKPFEQTAYLSEPYRFKSSQDFESCIEKARGETLESLYRKVKSIWLKYIDADDFHISICTADSILTYYQDKMGLTHYLFFIGGNNCGKSNNLLVLKYLAYRNFTSTDMTAANIYQFLVVKKGKGLYAKTRRIESMKIGRKWPSIKTDISKASPSQGLIRRLEENS